MNKFDGVANTLFVPLVARINISKKFPEYFMDEKALELEKYLPQGADKGSSEYSNMASVARYYNMDKTVTAFAKSYAESNIVLCILVLTIAKNLQTNVVWNYWKKRHSFQKH